ncbi:MAG: aminotransferase class I/II-fold pyridoxal phosphate-dependent enzyme, partial [Lentisphaerae bacterium]
MNDHVIPLSIPFLGEAERRYIQQCLDENYISHVGPLVPRFEQEFAKLIGSQQCVSLINGTAALHLALKLAGVTSGDLVFVPALTFIAPVNAITYCGAEPFFLDTDPQTLAISPDQLSDILDGQCERRNDGSCIHLPTGRRIGAVVVVHLYGFAADIENLCALCDTWDLPLIEDAAEAVGCTIAGKHLGTFGAFGCFSFNGNKALTTGGGGMLTASDSRQCEHARHLATQAKSHPELYIHDEIGYNYRMSNLHAAIGLGQ